MANNPFEDPDVQAAAEYIPQQQNGIYGDDNAYNDETGDNKNNLDDDHNGNSIGNGHSIANSDIVQGAAKYIPQEQQKLIAISTGSAVANKAADEMKKDYNNSIHSQSDQHQLPPPPPFCIKMFNWFPLQIFAFIAGAALIIGPLLDILIIGIPEFIQFFIYIHLILFGIVTMCIEAPRWTFTRYFQLKFFFWVRILSRMWGRAWFYLFISLLCYAPVEKENSNDALFSVIGGVYLTIICVLSFVFSRMSGKKFARIREYVAAGTEGDELKARFINKFNELELASKPGAIGSAEIVKLAEQAGRTLSNSERHAIQTFLDESCNGYVSKEDFMKQFVTQYQKTGFKQKYL